jgi:AcrR family transcriptional regulator
MRIQSEVKSASILKNAKELFLTNGYVATTLDQIAEKAHTTKSTLYNHFKDKEQLLKKVIDDLIGVPWVFTFPINDIQNKEDLFYILYNVARGIRELFSDEEYVQLIRILIPEISSHPEISNMLDSGITRRSLALVTKVLTIANEKGILTVENPEFRAKTFVGGLLVDFYSDGLLSPQPLNLRRYSHEELMVYVATSMPILTQSMRGNLDKHK